MEKLIEMAKALGAYAAGTIPVKDIPFDPTLRAACEANYCGNFGKNWTCPPTVGEINELIAQAKTYKHALVYQTVTPIEDSFDFEGMVEASKRHAKVTDAITEMIFANVHDDILRLSAGGCPVCEVCAKRTDEPCRNPDKALASLEAYGIYVAKLAAQCGMKYINGPNTVTYFGAYLIGKEPCEQK